MIQTGSWLGNDVVSMWIGEAKVRSFILTDCAFPLSRNVMRTTSVKQQNVNSNMLIWERVASETRRPVECAFGILKNRFRCIKDGISFHHEDDIAYVITACVALRNICISEGDECDDFNDHEYNTEAEDLDLNTEEADTGKHTREALIHYIRPVQVRLLFVFTGCLCK